MRLLIKGSPIVFPPRTESISQSPKRERLLTSSGLSSINFPRCFLVEGQLIYMLESIDMNKGIQAIYHCFLSHRFCKFSQKVV